ncbi:hypothetical protein HQ489_05255 [Candidatus Woesearchaeota archaeon]|nr:hypothetical protein [Candidatus Woesearchaeota archaeon]
MNGIIGNEKGILIPYEKYCKKVGVPKGYFLEDIQSNSSNVIYYYMAEKECCILKDGLFIVKEDYKRVIMKKTKKDIEKSFGFKFQQSHHSICIRDKNGIIERHGFPIQMLNVISQEDKNLFVWISQNAHYYEEEMFVEI